MQLFFSVSLLLLAVQPVLCRLCVQADYRYEYTECTKAGDRWRVSVPKTTDCQPDPNNPPPLPAKGRGCLSPCEPGTYLALSQDQECHRCPVGTYSLGGGLRFDAWKTLPKALVVRSYANSLTASHLSSAVNCSGSGWVPRGEFLEALSRSCTVELILDVEIAQRGGGKVSFVYQHSDHQSLFQFKMENGCSGKDDSSAAELLDHTANGQWITHAKPLTGGTKYTLTWKVTGLHSSRSVGAAYTSLNAIKRIDITGVKFTSSCTPCPAGTYSSGGTPVCSPCPSGTFSKLGAGTCTSCNSQTQFSHKGSSQCYAKPACTVSHYQRTVGPCVAGKMRTSYSWATPLMCNPRLPHSVTLPKPSITQPCPRCNPGMSRVLTQSTGVTKQGDGLCHECPVGTWSDGEAPCERCSVGTVPARGVAYVRWDSLPPNVTLSCIDVNALDSACVSRDTWRAGPDGQYMESSHLPSDAPRSADEYSVLSLHVGGFEAPLSPYAYAKRGGLPSSEVIPTVTFTFELDCDDSSTGTGGYGGCTLLFMESKAGKSEPITLIQQWTGSTSRSLTYTHHVWGKAPRAFSWAFQRLAHAPANANASLATTFLANHARLHSINVSGTLYGGASSCKACHMDGKTKGCISCPHGQYWHELPAPTIPLTPTPSASVSNRPSAAGTHGNGGHAPTSPSPQHSKSTNAPLTHSAAQGNKHSVDRRSALTDETLVGILANLSSPTTTKQTIQTKVKVAASTAPHLSTSAPSHATSPHPPTTRPTTATPTTLTSSPPPTTAPSPQPTGECRACPPGTLLRAGASQPLTTHSTFVASGNGSSGSPVKSLESLCESCPHGLYSPDYSTCASDCRYMSANGLAFDFSALSGRHSLQGRNMFSGDGTKYFHNYHFSICNKERPLARSRAKGEGDHSHKRLVTCTNNATLRILGGDSVESMVCQNTVLPTGGRNDEPITTQPFSLGDTIANVSVNDRTVLSTLHDAGYTSLKEDDILLTMFMVSTRLGRHQSCPGGRRTTIFTLHCDPLQREGGEGAPGGSLQMPPAAHCQDATCGGCTYMFVWHTPIACPRCDPGSFEVVRGQCVQGKQSVHYIPPKHCLLLGQASKRTTVVDCVLEPELPIPLWILISIAVGVLAVCLCCIGSCWCRNRRLEYRYTQLKNSGKLDGCGEGRDCEELPPAPSCALSGEDDSDDDEEEAFSVTMETKKRFYGSASGRQQFENVRLMSPKYSDI